MTELYINGMNTLEDVTNMIKDNIDRGDLEDAKAVSYTHLTLPTSSWV